MLEGEFGIIPYYSVPRWSIPFEIICEAGGVALGSFTGQRQEKVLHSVYYPSKALNPAQKNYISTKQELLAVVLVYVVLMMSN